MYHPHFASALFKDALRLKSYLVVPPGQSRDRDAGAKEAVQICSPPHLFMNMSLPEGVFQSVTGSELARLVCAVFEDSDKRRKLLRLLESN